MLICMTLTVASPVNCSQVVRTDTKTSITYTSVLGLSC